MGWLFSQLLNQFSSTTPRSAGKAEVVDDVEVVGEGPGQQPGEDEAGDDVGQGHERVLADIERVVRQLTDKDEEDMQCWRRW